MIRKDHRIEIVEIARLNEAELAGVAFRVADAVHALISGCTAAVVLVEAGHEWRMLGQSGPEDVSGSWRRLVARTVRIDARAPEQARALVLPISSERVSTKLVIAPLAAISLPQGTRRIVQPLLDAGGILLDAAVSGGRAPRRQGLRLVSHVPTEDAPAWESPRYSATASSAGR